jgi:Tol biopolymer transport system component
MLDEAVPTVFIGCGYRPGNESASQVSPGATTGGQTMAHEIAHNSGRQHAPCGSPANPDPNYPNADSSHSRAPALSADGRYVAFTSLATNLDPSDTNAFNDIYVHDRQTGTTSRVSLGPAGAATNGQSDLAGFSADGTYVVFKSTATNLMAGDALVFWDVFVHNRQTHTTARVSSNQYGVEANRDSNWPAISADGGHVAPESTATNLVSGDTNDGSDIFLYALASP